MQSTISKMKSLWILFALCLFPVWAFAQNFTATGTVIDNTGEPVPGASVVAKGTTNGVMTDIDGNFELKVAKGTTLVFSYIGYETIERPADSKMKITLQEDNKLLEDVVVIGYGTARRSDLTGSIASIGGDNIREVAASDVTEALQGRIAGVDLTSTNSQPGASMQIRIRGQRSLTASNDPLIVLDGIPFMGELNDIAPSSIKSMDILKDAASTAIYGARGANGVIMITTFKGVQEQPAQVKYSAYVGFSNAQRYPLMNAKQLAELRDLRGQYTDGPDESRSVDTDWQDLFFRTGVQTNHNINVSGGNKGGSYNVGLGYNNNQGVVPTQGFERFNLSANFDQKIGNYFRFGITTNNTYSISRGSHIGLYHVLAASPMVDPYNEDGSLKHGYQMATDQYPVYTREAIEANKDSYVGKNENFASYNSVFAELSQPWIEGLTYRVNLGGNLRFGKNGRFTGTGVMDYNTENPNSASLTRSQSVNWTIENLLTYDHTFAEKHHVNVVGMYSAEQTNWDRTGISGQKIPAEYFQYYNIGYAEQNLKVDPNSQGYTQSGLMSWMGRAIYTYDSKYMLSVAVRSDASSRLAKGHQWHTYPAVSAGWNIDREAFMEGFDWINQLKLRVGYGETSNQSINPYSTLGGLAVRNYNFGDADYQKGYYVSALPNPDLGWEFSQTWNYGLDFGFLNGRISGTFEYYTQATKDLLLNVKLPATSGVSSYTGNVGETENKGFEFSINGIILDNYNGWTWKAGLNFYQNRNKIVRLATVVDGVPVDDEGNGWFIGHPIDVIYDVKKIGIWQEGDKYLDILEPGGNVGMVKVEYTGDYNADGTPTRPIGSEDRQVMDLEPDLMGGFNTSVSYKGFDLSVIGSFKIGGKIVSTLYNGSGFLNPLTGRRGQVDVDYWTPENTGADFPYPAGIISGDSPKYASTLGYFDADYLKIRTITLGYTFKPSMLKPIGLKNLRVYASVQNPLTISSYTRLSGQDPEPNTMSNNSSYNASSMTNAGHGIPVVGTNAPFTRNFLFGLDVTF